MNNYVLVTDRFNYKMEKVIKHMNSTGPMPESSKQLISEHIEIFNDIIKKKPIDHEHVLGKNNKELFSLIGICYNSNRQYDLMGKYYSKAIQMGSILSMCNYARFYEIEKNYSDAEKYYKMAIKENDPWAMIKLGRMYDSVANSFCKISDDTETALKYYNMALDKGILQATQDIAWHYSEKKKDNKTALKYYLMAPMEIQKRNTARILHLLIKENNYDNFEQHVISMYENPGYGTIDLENDLLETNSLEAHIIINYVKCTHKVKYVRDLNKFFKDIFPKLNLAVKRKYYYKLEFIINCYFNELTRRLTY